MWKYILIAVAVVVVLLLIVIAAQPSDFRVTRTARLTAPVSVVYQNVNTLRKWDAWSPWAKIDPNAKSTFEGPESGPGSSMTWSGNNKVGEGRMTIIDSRTGERVQLKLEFVRPFKAVNTAEFTFKPEGGQTVVTWTMSGKNNFMGKAIGLLMNCDKMVGGEFEKGLASLDSVTRAIAKAE
jgi:Polyketide cyclase / dehydrase and lipid transport